MVPEVYWMLIGSLGRSPAERSRSTSTGTFSPPSAISAAQSSVST